MTVITHSGPTLVIRPARVLVCKFTKATGEVVDVYTNTYVASWE